MPCTSENYGFLSGLAGEIYFLVHYNKFYNLPACLIDDKVIGLLDSLSNYSGNGSFCSGVAGVCYLLSILNEEYGYNILIDERIHDYLNSDLTKKIKMGRYEFLYGIIGTAQYYLLNPLKFKKPINKIIDYLNRTKVIIDGNYAWTNINKQGNIEVNLALSHGMAAIIVFLAKVYGLEYFREEKELLYRLIKSSIDFIMSQRQNIKQYNSFFPYTASLTGPNNITSRLGWCYGDLSEGLAIYIGGMAIGHTEYVDFANKIMLYAACKRRNLSDNFVIDAGLCHGTSGIAAIFNRMWWNTGIEAYKEANNYWIKKTIELAEGERGLAGYVYKNNFHSVVSGSHLLEGITGIGLALLYHIHGVEPVWDSCLLMS